MRKIKTIIYQFRLRIRIAYRILFSSYGHFVVLNLDEKQFTNAIAQTLFSDEYISEIDMAYVGMREIHAYQCICYAFKSMDTDEMILLRAEFQADVDNSMLNANKNADGKR